MEVYFFISLEVGNPIARCEHAWVLMRALLLASERPPSCCVLTWHTENYGKFSAVFLIRVSILLYQGPALMIPFNLNYLPQTLSLNTVTLGIRGSTYGFVGGHSLAHNTLADEFLPLKASAYSLTNTGRFLRPSPGETGSAFKGTLGILC